MYYEEIEKYFIRKRERAATLSPIDWPIVKSWEERGIPLEVVFKGIDNAFVRFQEKNSSEENAIRSLAYCQYDVESCWQTYQEMVVGKPVQESRKDEPQDAERERTLNHLDKLIAELTRSLEMPEYEQIGRALNQAMLSLHSLRSQVEISPPTFDPAEIRGQLKELEEDLISAIEKTLPTTQVKELSAGIEQKLARYKEEMSSRVYMETFRTVFRKELKTLFPLPAFDLF